MAMTLADFERHLTAMDLNYRRRGGPRDAILLGFRTEHYRDGDGDNFIRLAISLEQEGRFLKVFAPMVYQVPEGPTREAAFTALLHVSWRTKMVQFEYDLADGEVRAMVEFPIEDGTVTQKQLERVIHGLAAIVDKYDEFVRGAIETGKVVPPEPVGGDAAAQRLLALLERAADADPEAIEAALAALAGGGAVSSGSGDGPTEL